MSLSAAFGLMGRKPPCIMKMERRRILGPRLEAVASFIPAGAKVADVGTDHGLLAVWLRMHEISPVVIASDIRPGPLNAAKRNAEKYRVNGICFRLCPGLQDIRQDEADIVVIAGMSGETILSILDDSGWDWINKQLVLEANTKHPELLTWLYQHKLHLEGEKIPEENGRLYRVFHVAYGEAETPRPAFLWGGFTPGPFAARQASLLRGAMPGLSSSADPGDQIRFRTYKSILEDMKDAYHWSDLELPGKTGPAGSQNGF